MIKIEDLCFTYPGAKEATLNKVNMEIEKGDFVALIGNNGCGKSTLIKLLLKELNPTEGVITVNGHVVNKLRRRHIPKFRRNIGVVFQDFRLLKEWNVYENVAFAMRVVEASQKEIRKRE